MKINNRMKFDFKGIFIRHFEKIILLGAASALIYLGMFGMGELKPLGWAPADLARMADQTERTIRDGDVKPKVVDPSVVLVPYDEKANWVKVGVAPEPFRITTKWEPSLFPEQVPRGEPKLYPVVNLRAESGFGAINAVQADPKAARNPGRGGANTQMLEGRRWIVVTGLIPIRDQLTAYLETFPGSGKGNRDNRAQDRPQYLTYAVERRIYNPITLKAGEWQKIDPVRTYGQERLTWSRIGAEQVDKAFIAPVPQGKMPMAYPLPPLAKKLFGPEVAYPPNIPLLSETLAADLEEQAALDVEKKKTEEIPLIDSDDILGNPTRPGQRSGISGGQGPGLTTGVGPGAVGAPKPKTTIYPEEGILETPVIVSHYLFRFFDFEIEEDKSYDYRVKLYLANPNYGWDVKNLVDPETAEKTYLETEYCEPSSAVAVGYYSRVLLKEVAAANAKRPGSEPTAKLLPIYFDMREAADWVADEKAVMRGQVANFPGISCFNPDPDPAREKEREKEKEKEKDTKKSGGSGSAARGGKNAIETKNFDIISDVCVLDMFGGYPVEGSEQSPGKILVMEPNGGLEIRDLFADYSETQRLAKPAPPPK